MEEKERLLAVDKDEEEEGFVKEEVTDLKNAVGGAEISSRRLICVDETSKVFMLLCHNNPTNPIIMFYMLINRTQRLLFSGQQ